MKLRSLILALLVALFTSGLIAADAASSTKTSELLRLLHYTKEAAKFRETIAGMCTEIRKQYPQSPAWWEALQREISVDAYMRWAYTFFDAALSEEELKELNAVFSSSEKQPLFLELARISQEVPANEQMKAVEDLRRFKGSDTVNELLAFGMGKTYTKYKEARAAKDAEERAEVIKLFSEAQGRVQARYK